jgi:signal-transduction protein with cAMP-binding, CBS, and nucleotidyltransferase domain
MTLLDGDSFGEKSIQEKKTRQTTCIASAHTICAVVGRNTYLQLIEKFKEQRDRKLVAML